MSQNTPTTEVFDRKPMSDEPRNGDDSDPEESTSGGRSTGIGLSIGIGSISDVLSRMIEVNVNDASPEPGVDRSAIDESEMERRRRDAESRRKRTKRVLISGPEPASIDTRRVDGEFVVIADLPGVNEEELTVALDPDTGELVIATDGDVVERVDLPPDVDEPSTAQFQNGVLEVTFRPDD